jgi:TatD DNase family protein
MGFYLGIGGVVTYKNAGLDKVLENIDLKHVVLETDAPYLTPVPHRGKRNETAYLKIIAEKIASIKNSSFEEVSKITSENAEMIFEK